MSFLVLTPDDFVVRLAPKQPLECLIRSGHFRFTHPSITQEHFPCPLEGGTEIRVRVASVAEGESLEIEQVLAWMAHHAMRPASALELLAVASLRPAVRRLGTFWAIGSRWADASNIEHVVGCSLWNDRRLRLRRLEPAVEWVFACDYFFCVPA
jgi:hypothetical protein